MAVGIEREWADSLKLASAGLTKGDKQHRGLGEKIAQRALNRTLVPR